MVESLSASIQRERREVRESAPLRGMDGPSPVRYRSAMDWIDWLILGSVGLGFGLLHSLKEEAKSDKALARLAALAGWFCAAWTSYLVGLNQYWHLDQVPLAFGVDAAIVAVLATCVLRMSRLAAIVLLAYYLASQAQWIAHRGINGHQAHEALMLTCIFLGGIRATFRYHRTMTTKPA